MNRDLSEPQYRTIIEPHRVKVVEPIVMTTRAQRTEKLAACGYNLFGLRAEDVMIDLLTDSGTAAMSAEQWAGVMRGDESYAGSPSFFRFEAAARDIFGYRHIIPTHQGRAAERILFGSLLQPGQATLANTHFDTTRANVEFAGGEALDLVIPEGLSPSSRHPFKGNIDLERLEQLLAARGPAGVALVLLTLTNNAGGGQPVSLENIRGARELARRHGVPFYLDACRFAENAGFIQQREASQQGRPVLEIAREMLRLGDGCTMSAKKDGMANMGGFIGTNDDELAERMRNLLILTEGFPTYGGLSGRDLEAIAQGLYEALDEDYLRYRLRSVEYLGERLRAIGVAIVEPPGGHAIYIDCRALLPQIAPLEYPGQTLAVELYLAGGIRSCEIGSVMLGRRDAVTGEEHPAAMELVRLAMPRRVYTQSHVDYVIEVLTAVAARRQELRGLRMVSQPKALRHFTARFEGLA
ncbi:MAG TPA: tryptophanase [Polyangiaceae bacterium]|nr:tryptophanase [Polyangiaceae bacterium]